MSQARITSVDAVRDFRAFLLTFADQIRDGLTSVDLESRRTLEWILARQPAYWEAEVRRQTDAVQEAKKELHRCRSWPTPGGGVPSCLEEKKALERATARLRRAEEKQAATRRWGPTVQREVNEYEGRSNQLAAWMDGSLPQAIVYIDRSLRAIEAYMALHGSGGAGSSVPQATSMASAAQPVDEAPPAPTEPQAESATEPEAAETPSDAPTA